MSAIRDIVDIFKDIKDYDEVSVLKNKPKGSLTRMTKDAVLQFPVIASNSLDIQLIGMVNKALERNFATLLKIAFSLNSITDETDLTNYIRQFHQNTGLSDREFTSNLVVDRLVNESKIQYKFTSENLTESDKVFLASYLRKDNHRLLREYLNELNTDKLNDKMVYLEEKKSSGGNFNKFYQGGNNNNNQGGGKNTSGKENQDVLDALKYLNTRFDGVAKNASVSKRATSSLVAMNKKMDRFEDKVKNMVASMKKKPEEEEYKPTYTKRTMGGKQGATFTTADVVKANEIMPLPLEVKVYITNDKGDTIEQDFMIGIKAVIHPVSSDYMVESLMDGYRRGKFFFNFIKATTGEIKFFRDFLFMVDNIKTDAIKNASGTNNKWFTFLKRRALLAKAKSTLRMKNQLLPNTSIVLSGEEAEVLKQQGVDILNPTVARDLISEYFLLSIVVVDPALEIVHIIYDGEESYSSMSVMALNRESKEDNSTKQILSLLKSRPQF